MTVENPLRLPEYQNQWGQGYLGDICSTWNAARHSRPARPEGIQLRHALRIDGSYGGENDGVGDELVKLDGLRSAVQLTTAGAADAAVGRASGQRVSFFQQGRTITTNAPRRAQRSRELPSVAHAAGRGGMPEQHAQPDHESLSAGDITPKLSASSSIQYIQNQGNNRPGTGYDEGGDDGLLCSAVRSASPGLSTTLMDADGNQIS